MRLSPFALTLMLVLPVAPAVAIEPDAPAELISAEEAIGIKVRQRIENAQGAAAKAPKEDREALVSFYRARDGRPLWIDSDRLSLTAKAVASEIRAADDWGLQSDAFDLAAVDAATSGDTASLVAAETALSVAALKYANHARGGRIPEPNKQLSSYLDRKPQLIEPKVVLDELVAADDPAVYLRELNPQHPQFLALRKALLKLRRPELDESGERIVEIPMAGPTLSRGERHPDVVLLRRRLNVAAAPVEEGDAGDPDPQLFDAAVEEAVRDFQKENGLYVDGVVGSNTRASFNGGKAELTEEKLIANMEQWRWMPTDLGDFYVTSNVPEYKVRVVHEGETVHEERIIVGKLDKQTPVFSDTMETVVFHPFWGVPNSIKVNEILPSLARGGSVLQRQNLRLQYRGRPVDPQSVDWRTADIRNFHVYQPPGGGNVLGQVKFMFPNHHQVYMHDTPTKNLFNERQRTFSHGCMRVRNPLKLAEAVLKYDRGWDHDQVQSVVDNGPENNNVKLDRKVHVHVTYFTAVADENGEVRALRDIYGHEKRIKLALAGRWNAIDKGRDHLAPVALRRPRIEPQYSDPISDIFKQAFGFGF